jgi:putative RNA 2'-phosphotransferase
VSPEQLSRLVSHALRHEPWLYELELDDEGWVPVAAVLDAIHLQGPEWSQITTADLEAVIAASAKRRHEIDGDRIRALYGHSVPGRVLKIETDPPAELFHGTSPQAWVVIQQSGLRPMGRQYVHLSIDLATAEQVGRRKSATPVILIVHAERAKAAGARFWRGNDSVWLADYVPSSVIAPTAAAEGDAIDRMRNGD